MVFNMKKILLLFISVWISYFVLGQGNLQFNQTLLLNGTLSYSKTVNPLPVGSNAPADTLFYVFDSVTVNVPAQKTLKIESVSTGNRLYHENSTTFAPLFYFPVSGGLSVYINNVTLENSALPMWLPSGSYKVKFYSYIGSYLNNSLTSSDVSRKRYYYGISGIEFNIIP